MERIDLKCRCGASASFEDERQKEVRYGSGADDENRIFQIEVAADRWLDRHAGCLKPEVTGPADPVTVIGPGTDLPPIVPPEPDSTASKPE